MPQDTDWLKMFTVTQRHPTCPSATSGTGARGWSDRSTDLFYNGVAWTEGEFDSFMSCH